MKRRERIIVLLKRQALWARLDILGRSQNWLAREIGISRGYLSTLINDGRAPSGRIRRRMQEVLGVEDFDELFALERHDDRP
ncbi:MAG: helix-turn-helix transcriptional regulator [Chloroflexi bacterium]|nr:helix-turn-helix transcriptional regulator [Chloroflexota bacterium]